MENKMKNSETILIIGASGGLSNILCGLLGQNHPNSNIIGVDSRDLKNEVENSNFKFKKMRYTRGNFEKLFRENDIDIIYHLGRMSHSKNTSANEVAQRLSLNLMGTNRILELSIRYKIKRVVVLSTHHVYGALSDNPVFIKEDANLRASIKYPELRDVTEMDSMCTNWMWKYKDEMDMIVLRPCNIIGPQINNSISQYLRSNMVPAPIDFNPMFQFIHELDMATVLMNSKDKVPTGVYNIAPEETISLHEAKRIVGTTTFPFPLFLLSPVAQLVKKIWTFPDYLIDYIKFSCIIDGSEIKKHIPKSSLRFSTDKALKLLNL